VDEKPTKTKITPDESDDSSERTIDASSNCHTEETTPWQSGCDGNPAQLNQ